MLNNSMFKKIIIYSVLILFYTSIYGESYPVMLKIKTSEKLPDILNSSFRSGSEEILTRNNYSLIDEKAQNEALKEQASQHKSDCYDDACLVDTGKMLAARGLFIVDIISMEKDYLFKIRFIDFETGETKSSVTQFYKKVNINDAKQIYSFSQRVTQKILDSILNNLSKGTNSENILEKQIELNITSNPKESKIFIDKKLVGITPKKLFIKPGNHTIKVEKTGYISKKLEDDFYVKSNKIFLLDKVVYIAIEPFNETTYKAEGDCIISENKDELKVIQRHGMNCKLIFKRKYYITEEINISNTPRKITISLKKDIQYKLINNVSPRDAKITVENKLTKDSYQLKDTLNLPLGNYKITIRKDGYFTKRKNIDLTEGMELNDKLLRGGFLRPNLFTDFTFSSDILYYSLGLGLKFITIQTTEIALLEINGKVYRNMTDSYFYLDLEATFRLNLLNNLYAGISLPFRLLLTDKYSSNFAMLPTILVGYTLYENNFSTLDFEFKTYVPILLNGEGNKKIFFLTGLSLNF